MSNDGQNFEHPVNPSDDTQPQPAVNVADEVAGQQSRRKFLRTAVISGVAVATVGTTAGVAAAAANPHPGVLKRLGINLGRLSAQASCSMCWETSGFDKITGFDVNHTNGNASPPSYFIWFTAQNLPAGTYTLTVSPDPGASPFKYAANVNGNAVFLYQRTAGSTVQCPHFDPAVLPGDEKEHASTLAGINPWTTSGPQDLQWAIHIDWNKVKITSDTIYTFTGTLKDGQGNTVCTASVSATAHVK